MLLIILSVILVLVLVVGGCACVVWAARGGPPWTRVVAGMTMAAGELVRVRPSNGGRNSGGDTSTGGGSDG